MTNPQTKFGVDTLSQPTLVQDHFKSNWTNFLLKSTSAFLTLLQGRILTNICIKVVYIKVMNIYTWSAHQYQIDAGVWPKRNPAHGISELIGSRSICHESLRGIPQVELVYRVSFGIAAMYFTFSSAYPPTLIKPGGKNIGGFFFSKVLFSSVLCTQLKVWSDHDNHRFLKLKWDCQGKIFNSILGWTKTNLLECELNLRPPGLKCRRRYQGNEILF